MKKTALLVSIILLIFTIIGCSNEQNNGKKMNNGSFYSLNNLYKNKRINDNDLLNIAYRNNGGFLYNDQGEELAFIPEVIVKVEELSKDLLDMIINDYFDMLMEDDYFINEKLEISDIKMLGYFGVYNGYYAMRFQDNKTLATVSGEENIGGLKFIYPYAGDNKVILWKKNK